MNISSQSWTKWYFSMYNVHILFCLLKSSQIYDLLYMWHRYIFSPHIFFFFCQGRLRSLSHLEKISQLHEQNPLNSRLQATGQQPGEELLPEDEPAQPAEAGAQPFAPDEAVLSQLVDMGFSRNGCTRALYETKNSGIINFRFKRCICIYFVLFSDFSVFLEVANLVCLQNAIEIILQLLLEQNWNLINV